MEAGEVLGALGAGFGGGRGLSCDGKSCGVWDF